MRARSRALRPIPRPLGGSEDALERRDDGRHPRRLGRHRHEHDGRVVRRSQVAILDGLRQRSAGQRGRTRVILRRPRQVRRAVFEPASAERSPVAVASARPSAVADAAPAMSPVTNTATTTAFSANKRSAGSSERPGEFQTAGKAASDHLAIAGRRRGMDRENGPPHHRPRLDGLVTPPFDRATVSRSSANTVPGPWNSPRTDQSGARSLASSRASA